MTKEYSNGSDLNQKILQGVDILANNVASTLGPRGRNVILQKKGATPIITKDGVTVAEFVDLEDPMQNVGVQIVKQASSQTNSDAGDGTTTATVLARSMLVQAQKHLAAGASPIELKRGIGKAVEVLVNNLKSLSEEVSSIEDIKHIATISANGDVNIGDLIATAVDAVGKDGAITVEEARSLDTSLELVEGFRFDAGYVATAFINDERRGVIKYDDPIFLITDHKVEAVEQLLPSLEIASRENRPLIVVADEVSGQALAALIMNTVRGTLKVVAVKPPRYGEERRSILSDLAASVGATYITRDSKANLQNIKLEHFGRSKSIEVEKYITTIVGGRGDHKEVEKRIEGIKAELSATEDLHECHRIQERITRLASGIAIIKVGAPTEIEMLEKRHRVEDALEAVRSAQQEGMLPGGGVALVRAVEGLEVEVPSDEQALGVGIVRAAAAAPLRQMAENAGLSPDMIQNLVESEHGTYGYDFVSGDCVDMYVAGIIDPLKVTRSALQNAASVAGILITTSYGIVER